MKKVLSLMIVVAAAAMVSCAGKQAKQAETVEVEATEVVETPACCEEPAACEKADSCATACETPAETPAPAEAAKVISLFGTYGSIPKGYSFFMPLPRRERYFL